MDEPLPKWLSALIAIPTLAGMIWLIVVLKRRGERQIAQDKAEAFRKAMSSLHSPLDERQKELLQNGVMPWYEMPIPAEKPKDGESGPDSTQAKAEE